MKRSGSEPENKRLFECPQCKKRRMTRPFTHIVSYETREYTTYKKDTIELYVDICNFCILKNKKKYFEPSKADLDKMLSALKTNEEDGPSLEDLL
jgi:hypothetical protein